MSSSGTRCCITGYLVPDIQRHSSSIIFRDQKVLDASSHSRRTDTSLFTTIHVTQFGQYIFQYCYSDLVSYCDFGLIPSCSVLSSAQKCHYCLYKTGIVQLQCPKLMFKATRFKTGSDFWLSRQMILCKASSYTSCCRFFAFCLFLNLPKTLHIKCLQITYISFCLV